MEQVIKFAVDHICYYNNFGSTRRTRELNNLVEELQEKIQPKDTYLKDVIIVEEWTGSYGSAHSRYFRFKFVFSKKTNN